MIPITDNVSPQISNLKLNNLEQSAVFWEDGKLIQREKRSTLPVREKGHGHTAWSNPHSQQPSTLGVRSRASDYTQTGSWSPDSRPPTERTSIFSVPTDF